MGYRINEYAEDALPAECLVERHVFSMARDHKVLKILQQHESNGAVVVNSGYGVENCFRSNMMRRLNEAKISVPPNFIVETDRPEYHSSGGCGFCTQCGYRL